MFWKGSKYLVNLVMHEQTRCQKRLKENIFWNAKAIELWDDVSYKNPEFKI